MPENTSDIDLSNNQTQPIAPSAKPKSMLSRCFAIFYQDRGEKTILSSFKQKVADLTLSQWFYIFAGLLLLLSADQDVNDLNLDPTLIWVGVIAGIGLIRELWHVFNRLWENMLGKGLILVLYAATANFALAIAALKVNNITGIEPGPFVFTIGFTTLLMLPLWLLISSIVFFTVALIVNFLWLILSVLLRIVRIKVKVHWEDKSFVFATMFMRVILIHYVIASIFYFTLPFAEQIEILDNPISVVREALNDQEHSDINATGIEAPGNGRVTIEMGPEMASIFASEPRLGNGAFDQLIAHFIYHFETYPYSACEKSAQQRSLPIDENLILLVEKDESEFGYHFFVAPCEANYTEVLN